jgi:hypothetical protein
MSTERPMLLRSAAIVLVCGPLLRGNRMHYDAINEVADKNCCFGSSKSDNSLVMRLRKTQIEKTACRSKETVSYEVKDDII